MQNPGWQRVGLRLIYRGEWESPHISDSPRQIVTAILLGWSENLASVSTRLGMMPHVQHTPAAISIEKQAAWADGRKSSIVQNVPFGGRVPSPLSRPCATLALAALTRVNVVGFRRHYLTVDGVVGLYYSGTGCYGERYRLNPVRSCICQGTCLWGRCNE
jgi:hypothetical protein